MLESGDIIAKFAKDNNVDPSSLPGYNFIFGNKEKTMMKFLVEVLKNPKRFQSQFHSQFKKCTIHTITTPNIHNLHLEAPSAHK